MVKTSINKLTDILVDNLNQVQISKTSHNRALQLFVELYQKNKKNNEVTEYFKKFLIEQVNKALVVKNRDPSIDRFFSFIARLSLELFSIDEKDQLPLEDIFFYNLINHLLKCTENSKIQIRFKSCLLIYQIFSNFNESTEVEEEVFNEIFEKMKIRLQDRKTSVRTVAVKVLQKLQTQDEDDPVVRLFFDMLSKEGSEDVRSTIIQTMVVTKSNLPTLLIRARDIKPRVRKSIYILISQVKLKVFNGIHKHLIDLLSCGCSDRDPIVTSAFTSMLASSWMKSIDDNIITLLELIKVEENEKLSIDIINILLDQNILPKNDFFKDLGQRLSKCGTELKGFAETITPEYALLWRCYLEFLQKKETVVLYSEIKETLITDPQQHLLLTMKFESSPFIFKQLLLILNQYEYFNDSILLNYLEGKLLDLNFDIDLKSSILLIFRKYCKTEKEFYDHILNVLSDIQDPIEDVYRVEEEEEIKNLRKLHSLTIISYILSNTNKTIRDPVIDGLKDYIVDSIQSEKPEIREKAFKCNCLYILLDDDPNFLYKNNGMLDLYLSALSKDHIKVQMVVATACFDLLTEDGMNNALIEQRKAMQKNDDIISIDQPETEKELLLLSTSGNFCNKFLNILFDNVLLIKDTNDQESKEESQFKLLKVEGIAKLFYNNIIKDQKLLNSLIILFFIKETSDTSLGIKQILSTFFQGFVLKSKKNSELFVNSFTKVLTYFVHSQNTKGIFENLISFYLTLLQPNIGAKVNLLDRYQNQILVEYLRLILGISYVQSPIFLCSNLHLFSISPCVDSVNLIEFYTQEIKSSISLLYKQCSAPVAKFESRVVAIKSHLPENHPTLDDSKKMKLKESLEKYKLEMQADSKKPPKKFRLMKSSVESQPIVPQPVTPTHKTQEINLRAPDTNKSPKKPPPSPSKNKRMEIDQELPSPITNKTVPQNENPKPINFENDQEKVMDTDDNSENDSQSNSKKCIIM
ncbi:hypothetical protein DLAC_07874 [Tieghemostelium lacteum]|uniref:Nuclear condensin complex subunit 3 C-terminal domain-containing protein n=1 Tax=Tieghemostelium lacteum TaxID=361077 RepID=A0A151ZAL7_TIELA|nr:hypothetical protein DLAC_07874 [Tieghemostelium lacteum]|eukprot:KYQ90985.1 hypothetical protein DLAC_07874 [Tieghemostelium lacteum]